MVDARVIKTQLKAINEDQPFWVKAELRELPNIIVEGETIKHLVAGRYEGGMAIFVASDQRALIIDKKPMFLSVEDVRYEMLSEINYSHKLFDSVVHINSFNKSIWFSSFRKSQLRQLTSYIQQRLSEMRNQEATESRLMEDYLTSQQQSAAGLTPTKPVPYTPQAWEQVNERVNTVNTYANKPMFMRHRVSKFDTRPGVLPE